MQAGILIRETRLRKKIRQVDLSRKIGISNSYLNDVEHMTKAFPVNDMIVNKISEELDISRDYLFYLSDRFPKNKGGNLSLEKFEMAMEAFRKVENS
jgi:transcriptional regulator with XRE-family HTH domain